MKSFLLVIGATLTTVVCAGAQNSRTEETTVSMQLDHAQEEQVTHAPHGHILTNIGVWSSDSQWIVYDTRSDAAGAVFDGLRIERVNVSSGKIQQLYQSSHGAHCGVVTCSPTENKVAFILGPEHPTPDWQYAANHRRGVIVDTCLPGKALSLDARDLELPLTVGALRGGSHVHVFSADGRWVSYTYQDHLLAQFDEETAEHDVDLRSVGISVPIGSVQVSGDHPRNHNGEFFSVLVTRTTATPTPGSDQIKKAYEDGWVGANGYRGSDGKWQQRAIAFQGDVVTDDGRTISEAFIVDLPDDVTVAGSGPLEGTMTRRPLPPKGTVQRRLTFSTDRKYPGLQGPRHWLRSTPDGARIAMLMKDDDGIVQIWTVSPNGGPAVQITRNAWDVASAFSWSPDGRLIAYAMDNSVFVTDIENGQSTRLTARSTDQRAPRPEACVFSPDGRKITYVRTVGAHSGQSYNQLFIVTVDPSSPFAPRK